MRQQPSFDFGGDALQGASSVNGLSIPVTANRGGTELGCDFGGAALQKVITVNELSIPTTVRSLSVPSCLIVEDVTEGGTVNKTTHIITCCESTAPLRSLCVSACGWAAGVRSMVADSSFLSLLGLMACSR